jgi:hypothetical protein
MHEARRWWQRTTGPLVIATLATLATLPAAPHESVAVTYYVRQTVGNDANDGLSAEKAWAGISKLSTAMQAGDTAYVGPGLYREQVTVMNGGTADKRVVFIADTTGQRTGDPPGVVMITGADPVDENVFTPQGAPGVYQADLPYKVAGVVEMDGAQYRYKRARDTKDHLVQKLSLLDVVLKLPASHFYDEDAKRLYIHTSDGKPPPTHEIEIIRRGAGIGMTGKHYVTVMGFTFRSMGDAGINFFEGSSHGIAVNNTSYGSRQGVRVYAATDVLVYGNTLFRNDNSGVYFAKASVNGLAIGNTTYENIKGVRWSSASVNGMAIDNATFDNREAGVAIEEANGVIVRRNTVANNKKAQLLVIKAEYDSNDNCFRNGAPDQLTADFVFVDHYKTLADYQRGKRQDLKSREGACGALPAKIDVRKLHAETMSYAERARKKLAGSQ